VIASSSGGLTYHFTRLSIGLKKKGHEVLVLSGLKEEAPNLSKDLAEAGIEHFKVHYVDSKTIFGIFKGAKDIAKIIKNEAIDVIHAQGATHTLEAYFARKISKRVKPPSIVTTIHHIPDEHFVRNFLRGLQWFEMIRILNNCSDLVIPVSHNTREQLVKHGVNPNKIVPVYNAIDLAIFDESSSKSDIYLKRIKDDEPIIVCGGNLIPRKGHLYYLMAAVEILRKQPATFYVVGGGPRRDYLEEFVRRFGIERHVVFTGRISWPEMYSLFSSVANICVSASIGELFPYYVLECMAAGKPVVATNVGGVAEAVIDGVNGYVVPPKDSAALADAIFRLINDPEKAKKMGINSRAIVEKKFNLPKIITELTECYELSLQN
jgi:glycosyltransferase involved in cell wall biosynthesis